MCERYLQDRSYNFLLKKDKKPANFYRSGLIQWSQAADDLKSVWVGARLDLVLTEDLLIIKVMHTKK